MILQFVLLFGLVLSKITQKKSLPTIVNTDQYVISSFSINPREYYESDNPSTIIFDEISTKEWIESTRINDVQDTIKSGSIVSCFFDEKKYPLFFCTLSSGKLQLIRVENGKLHTIGKVVDGHSAVFHPDPQSGIVYIGRSKSVEVMDFSKLDTPKLISTFSISGWSGEFKKMQIEGNILYAHRYSSPDTIHVFDISNSTNLVETYSSDWSGGDWAVLNSHLFKLDSKKGLQIYDVSNSSNPFQLLSETKVTNPKHIEIVGDGYSCIVSYEYGFTIIDLTDLRNPTEISAIVDFFASEIYIDGHFLFTTTTRTQKSAGVKGVNVFDISSLHYPKQLFGFEFDEAVQSFSRENQVLVIDKYTGLYLLSYGRTSFGRNVNFQIPKSCENYFVKLSVMNSEGDRVDGKVGIRGCAFSCFGKGWDEKNVCDGRGVCARKDWCDCSPLFYGQNCSGLISLSIATVVVVGICCFIVAGVLIVVVLSWKKLSESCARYGGNDERLISSRKREYDNVGSKDGLFAL